jgi:hypothetical protein
VFELVTLFWQNLYVYGDLFRVNTPKAGWEEVVVILSMECTIVIKGFWHFAEININAL